MVALFGSFTEERGLRLLVGERQCVAYSNCFIALSYSCGSSVELKLATVAGDVQKARSPGHAWALLGIALTCDFFSRGYDVSAKSVLQCEA